MSKTKVIWTASAIIRLQHIFQYYNNTASTQVARKIKGNIITSTDVLKTHPDAGQEEEFLKNLKEGHRYLVEGHHKIIYKLVGDLVYITDIFDSRQNPKKLQKRNK